MSSGRSPTLRLRQGFVLLVGAIVFSLVVGSGPDTFYWTPLGIGLVYLTSAVAGGRAGGYWSGALVLVGWGAAVAYAHEARPDAWPCGRARTRILVNRRGPAKV